MKKFETPQPEKIKIVGNVKDQEKINRIHQQLDKFIPFMTEEIVHTPEREALIEGQRTAFLEYGKTELNIDLSKRMSSLDQFHFFIMNNMKKLRK